jgi:hypothetical protein
MKSPPRHSFRFKIEGQTKPLTAKAKVRRATKEVQLILTASDVRQSIKMKGGGNTQTCSMAVCAKRQADAFSHAVDGYIDWQYRTAFVVSKVSKQTGMPIECVAYEHKDKIAKLNDTKGGQQKLLKELEAKGERVVRLLPIKKRTRTYGPRPNRAKPDGSRAPRPAGVGAKLRFAVAQLGGVG